MTQLSTTYPENFDSWEADSLESASWDGTSSWGATDSFPRFCLYVLFHPQSALGFFLFILVNAVLFVRPAEIAPELVGFKIYEPIILACLIASVAGILEQLTLGSLAARPISLCVFGLLGAVIFSQVFHGAMFEARQAGVEFLKVVVYYLLLVAVVNSSRRLRAFLYCLVGFITVLTVLALLQYHGKINIPSLEALERLSINEETGDQSLLLRLRSTGLFNDPNDMCLILLAGMAISMYGISASRFGLLWLPWLGLLGVFGYALALTQSRGGFFGLLAGVLVLCRYRFGWLKTCLLGGTLLPILFLLFSGRQTSFDVGNREDTAQSRILIWSDGLDLFHQEPLFGIGYGQFAEEVGYVVHNSFLHCFTELGVLGGTLFLAAFFLAIWGLHRVKASPSLPSPDGWGRVGVGGGTLDPELEHLRPFLMALTVAYIVGMFFLSRAYTVPTYMILGMATVYMRLAADRGLALRFDWRLVSRLALANVGFLVGIHAFVRAFANWG